MILVYHVLFYQTHKADYLGRNKWLKKKKKKIAHLSFSGYVCVFSLIESICSSKYPKERNFSDWWTIFKQFLWFQSQRTKLTGGKSFTWGKTATVRTHPLFNSHVLFYRTSMEISYWGRNTLNSVPVNLHFVIIYVSI